MKRRWLGAVTLALTAGLTAGAARAGDPFPQRAERLFSPGRNAASEDGEESIVTNPANLGFAQGQELRWNWVRCPDDAKKVGCGHAFGFATPLFWNIGTGLRVDVVQPPWGAGADEGVGFPFRGFDYVWATWGLGIAFSDAFAFGMSIQRSYSENAYVDGLVGVTAAMTLRPYRNFSFAAIAHDWNGPSTQPLLSTGVPVLDRSYVLSMAFRPTGRRDVEAGFEMKYLQGTDQWMPRVTAGVDIPNMGRVRGDVEMAHLPNDDRRSVVASLGLEIAIDKLRVGGGAFLGNGLGNNSTWGQYGTVAFTSFQEPAGVPMRQRAVYFRIESTPGTRGHVKLLRQLWAAAKDPDIAAVTLVLKSEPAESFARAEELADALRVLRAYGKKTLCSWEDAGSRSLYVCANADRIVVAPAGGLRYAGLAAQRYYLKGLLDKIGVRAEFVRVSPHKSAPETFTNEGASAESRADIEDDLRQREAVFVRNLSLGRHMPEDRVRATTLNGPWIASEAKEAGFVDGFAYDDEVEKATDELVGYRVPYDKYEDPSVAPSVFGPQPKIAVLYIDGDIADGRSQHIPILDMKVVGSYSIVEQVRALKDDPTVRGVILRINSPGGSSLASEAMWRELDLLGQKKPLIASMDSIAASGGYYVAAPARTIYAMPLTTTGSIGVFYGKADLSGLLGKLGINIETYKTTPRADAESLFRPYTPDERAFLGHKIEQFYDVFLDRVARGRHLTKDQVDAVGQGRVWTGQQAMERRLVDKMGGLRHALEEMRAITGLPADTTIAEYPPVSSSLLDTALQLAGGGSHATAIEALPPQIKAIARAVAPLAVYRADEPLARMPIVEVPDQ